MWKIPVTYLSKYPEAVTRKEFKIDVHAIKFNDTYHKSFCAELKMLYTIMTRAKRCIWMYEESPLEKLPMLSYWFCRDVIEEATSRHSSDGHNSQTLISLESTPREEWKKQGDSYMQKKLWQAAKTCYHKAAEMSLEKIAHAHFLEERAQRVKKKDPAQFREPAAIFIESCTHHPRLDLAHNAAVCLYKANMYSESTQLFEAIGEVSNYNIPHIHYI